MTEDLEHVKQLALGDHEAFRFIFMKYYPKMKYFIAHIVKSETIAEELSQDIFEKIWRNRAQLPALQSLNAYLYRMSRNIAINHIEHLHIEKAYFQGHDAGQDFPVDAELDAREIEMLVMLEVERMPVQRKRIFIMSRFEHFTNQEIAQELNITKKTVENHLNLALKQIRQLISLAGMFF